VESREVGEEERTSFPSSPTPKRATRLSFSLSLSHCSFGPSPDMNWIYGVVAILLDPASPVPSFPLTVLISVAFFFRLTFRNDGPLDQGPSLSETLAAIVCPISCQKAGPARARRPFFFWLRTFLCIPPSLLSFHVYQARSSPLHSGPTPNLSSCDLSGLFLRTSFLHVKFTLLFFRAEELLMVGPDLRNGALRSLNATRDFLRSPS